MTIDRIKLVKLLNLSTSDVDGEALVAVRKANSILKQAGVLWDKVLTGSGPSSAGSGLSGTQVRRLQDEHARLTVEAQALRSRISTLEKELSQARTSKKSSGASGADPFADSPYQEADDEATVEEMLETCLEQVQGTAHSFIQSLSDQFKKRGRLSENQVNALRKFYRNCV